MSKGYRLIKRFSEEIDIVVSHRGLMIPDEADPLAQPSATKRKKATDAAMEKCCDFFSGRMRTKPAAMLKMRRVEVDGADEDTVARGKFTIHRGDLTMHVFDEEEGLFPLLRQRCRPEDEVAEMLGRMTREHSERKDCLARARIALLTAFTESSHCRRSRTHRTPCMHARRACGVSLCFRMAY